MMHSDVIREYIKCSDERSALALAALRARRDVAKLRLSLLEVMAALDAWEEGRVVAEELRLESKMRALRALADTREPLD